LSYFILNVLVDYSAKSPSAVDYSDINELAEDIPDKEEKPAPSEGPKGC